MCRRQRVAVFACAILLVSNLHGFAGDFAVPTVQIQALKDAGVRVSIPDQEGLQFFAFNGRLNESINADGVGDINREVVEATNGRWQFEDKNVMLKIGDVISYWVFIQHNDLGYRQDNLKFTVDRLYSPNDQWPAINSQSKEEETITTTSTRRPTTVDNRSPSSADCVSSVTTINGGQSVCSGVLLFEDTFSTLDTSRWTVENRLPDEEHENPFVHYSNRDTVVHITNNKLHITPDLLQNILTYSEETILTGTLDLFSSCTGTESQCVYTASGQDILPPVISGRITTKKSFSFKYGTIEIKARVPNGDWLYPELFLEPAKNAYGSEGYASGMMRVGLVRGNSVLRNLGESWKVIDSKVVYAGVVLDQFQCHYNWLNSYTGSQSLANGFHTYSLTWSPDTITVSIDGIKYGIINAPIEGFGSFANSCNGIKELSAKRWSTGTSFAPFDQEFYIVLGVGAAGVTEFPDNTVTSEGKRKPWNNLNAKAKIRFWQKLTDWKKTWGKASLQVESVRVWAL